MVHSEPFLPSMARLDPCFFLVHMLVFQEMLLLFPLGVLHAQYAAIGAKYAATLLFCADFSMICFEAALTSFES